MRLISIANLEPVAVSAAYLCNSVPGIGSSQSRSVSLSGGVTVTSVIIPPGTTHRLAAVRLAKAGGRPRVCVLMRGKARVRLEAQDEMVMGQGAVWGVAPGLGCEIVNRAYEAAVVYVHL